MTDAADSSRLERRRAILAAMLPHVPFDGWSDRTLRRAAADADLDPAVARLAFPGGAAEVIAFWSDEVDRAAVAAYAARDGDGMKFRERIAYLVRARIEALAGDRESVRRALTHLAQPQHAGLGMQCLYRTVDELWHAAGDRSTDFNFYTKRLTLAGVYSSTLLFWLDDESDDSTETWRFLDRRIAGVMRIPARRQKLQQAGQLFPNSRRFARMVSERLREGRVG
ncbi:MAG: COQ9 family protein [Alphaproteobacteria bacterium]|nr:COQ9 family protein [Alphaproteobacteria bacterium]|tara:strand:+ start:264 stop:938 length:675 start_codon:yes stop_codon:yes gene_type:complete